MTRAAVWDLSPRSVFSASLGQQSDKQHMHLGTSQAAGHSASGAPPRARSVVLPHRPTGRSDVRHGSFEPEKHT